MAVPGFTDPAEAAPDPSGDLYFAASTAVKAPAETLAGVHQGQVVDRQPAELIFGDKFSAEGEAVHGPAVGDTAKSSWREVLNFRGSPAPWILIGILLVGGILHLEAETHGELGSTRFGGGVRL